MEQRYQIYLAGQYATEWTTLAKKIELPDGRIVKTKLLDKKRLQYARRNRVVGISDSEYMGGEPKPGQWRVHPADAAIKTTFAKAQPDKIRAIDIPLGVEFEKD